MIAERAYSGWHQQRRRPQPPSDPPETLALFSADELPPADRAYYVTARAQLADNDTTDRARFIRAKASGARWTCPDACTAARGDTCECPCGRKCHGAEYCPGH